MLREEAEQRQAVMCAGLEHALELLPAGLRLDLEEDFVQAGAILVAQITIATVALGELLDWKMRMEGAGDDFSRDAIFRRYAREWGTSHTSLVRAWVLATKYPEVARPEDTSATTQYEVLSGSQTPEQAEAGFDAVAAEGMGVQQVREAKMLQQMGLSEALDWRVPFLFYRNGEIWARGADGEELCLWVPVTHGAAKQALAAKGVAVARRRLQV